MMETEKVKIRHAPRKRRFVVHGISVVFGLDESHIFKHDAEFNKMCLRPRFFVRVIEWDNPDAPFGKEWAVYRRRKYE